LNAPVEVSRIVRSSITLAWYRTCRRSRSNSESVMPAMIGVAIRSAGVRPSRMSWSMPWWEAPLCRSILRSTNAKAAAPKGASR
jgi:hypothetical protein